MLVVGCFISYFSELAFSDLLDELDLFLAQLRHPEVTRPQRVGVELCVHIRPAHALHAARTAQNHRPARALRQQRTGHCARMVYTNVLLG